MSNYSPIYTNIWSDIEFTEYTPHRQLVFLHLLTNPNCKISGIYTITPKQIAYSTNIPLSEVKMILTSFEVETLCYDERKGVVYVKNFFKYNLKKGGNPKIVYSSVMSNISLVPHCDFWNDFYERYKIELKTLKQKVDNLSSSKKKLGLIQPNAEVGQGLIKDNINIKDKTKNKNKEKEEDIKLEKDFNKIYKSFYPEKKLRAIPFKRLKTKFKNCLEELGDVNELQVQIVKYLNYLEVASWRKKKSFEFWINNSGDYGNDWDAELEAEKKKKLGEGSKTLSRKEKLRNKNEKAFDNSYWVDGSENLRIVSHG